MTPNAQPIEIDVNDYINVLQQQRNAALDEVARLAAQFFILY